jgi:hypothetical protein
VTTATADFPNVIVEWSPTTGPDATAVWDDISQYVTSGKTTRGRQYEIDRFTAGTMTLELRTATRLFDPENTASTYYPNITPMRQIRVTSNWSSTTYSVFQGYITDWGHTQPDDKMFVTTITAKDAFERFDQIQLPSSAWALQVQNDGPSCWLRLGETQTARVSDTSPNGNYGLYDNCQQGQPSLVVNDSDGACTFAHSNEERVIIQNPSLIAGYPFTISAAIQCSGGDPAGAKFIFAGFQTGQTVTSPQIYFRLSYTADNTTPGLLRCLVYDGTNIRRVMSTNRVDDDKPHLVSVVCTNSSSFSMYADGVDVTQVTTAGHPAWFGTCANGYSVGNLLDTGYGDFGFGANNTSTTPVSILKRGTIDEVAVYSSAISATTQSKQAAAFTGWANDTVGTRLGRFLDAIAWPAANRDLQTGVSVLAPANWSAGATAMSVMQNWADTELGLLFMSADNKVTFRSRHSPLLDTSSKVSQTTFSDNASPRYQFVDLLRDTALIRNPVSAARRDGITVSVQNTSTTSGTGKYGARNWAAPVSEDSLDATMYDRATWLVARFKELGTRLASMTLLPRTDPTVLWPQVLGRLIGDRITVKRTPLGLNSEISLDFIIEGVEHSFGVGPVWTTVFRGATVDPNVGNYLILDDAAHGLLDTNILAY